MELLNGMDLQSLVAKFGPLPPNRAVHLLMQACESLGEESGGLLDRASGAREGQLVEGVLSGDALFAFNWQVALHGDPLSEAEMDALARAS